MGRRKWLQTDVFSEDLLVGDFTRLTLGVRTSGLGLCTMPSICKAGFIGQSCYWRNKCPGSWPAYYPAYALGGAAEHADGEQQQDLPAYHCPQGSSWSLAVLDSWVHIKGFMLALPWFPLERELLWCLPPENFLFQFLESFLEFVRTKCRLAQDL